MANIFHDVEAAACTRGGALDVGPWRVHFPKVFGFCGGVLKALKALEQALQVRDGGDTWLLGEIIHSDTVNAFFRAQGVRILAETEVESVFSKAQPDDCFVIPAFGIARELEVRVRAYCGARGRVIDTTCDYIRRVWQFAERVALEGRTIVIHGKPDHPETRATLSRALTGGNAVIQVPDYPAAKCLAACLTAGDVSDYPVHLVHNRGNLDTRRLALINQTTMLYLETCEIESLLAAAIRSTGGDLARAETLCRATQSRQNAALELCRRGCDVMLVVGGYASSNTTQLHRLARKHGPAYFISSAAALAADRITHYEPALGDVVLTQPWLPEGTRDIGLLAGASCPPSDIGAVIRRLRQIAVEAAG